MKLDDYWKKLEDENPDFKLNRRAYSLYCNDEDVNADLITMYYSDHTSITTLGFNSFCASGKIYDKYKNKVLRQQKLKRILKDEIC